MHLDSYRQGWQAQNIAKVLLSQFSFLSEPVNIGDDIGSDFYCTIFEKIPINSNKNLLPTNSFLIQIKSAGSISELLDISKYLPIFRQMDLPFIIGIVNKKELSMSLFSGELLPHFFALNGDVNCLYAEFIDKPKKRSDGDSWLNYIEWWKNISEDKNKLVFPKITEISLFQDEITFQNNVKEFSEICKTISKNLTSFGNQNFIFQDTITKFPIFYTRSSNEWTEGIETDIQIRLAEMFYHIFFLSSKGEEEKERSNTLFKIYANLYNQLSLSNQEIIYICRFWFEKANKKINE